MQIHLHLLSPEGGYTGGELLGVLGCHVVGGLLLDVGHDAVLQLQTQITLFLQLLPLIIYFNMVAAEVLDAGK